MTKVLPYIEEDEEFSIKVQEQLNKKTSTAITDKRLMMMILFRDLPPTKEEPVITAGGTEKESCILTRDPKQVIWAQLDKYLKN